MALLVVVLVAGPFVFVFFFAFALSLGELLWDRLRLVVVGFFLFLGLVRAAAAVVVVNGVILLLLLLLLRKVEGEKPLERLAVFSNFEPVYFLLSV